MYHKLSPKSAVATPSGDATNGKTDEETSTSVPPLATSPDRQGHGVSSCLSFVALAQNYSQLQSKIPSPIRVRDSDDGQKQQQPTASELNVTWRQVSSPPIIGVNQRTHPHTIASASVSGEGLSQLAVQDSLQSVPSVVGGGAKLSIAVPTANLLPSLPQAPPQAQTDQLLLTQQSVARDWHMLTTNGGSMEEDTKTENDKSVSNGSTQRVMRRPSVPLMPSHPVDVKKSKSVSHKSVKGERGGFVSVDTTDDLHIHRSNEHRCVIT